MVGSGGRASARSATQVARLVGAVRSGVGVCVVSLFAISAGAGQGEPDHGGPRLFTAPQAERGARIYASRCETCHGPDLSGGKVVPGVAGEAFGARWEGRSLRDLLDPVIASMPPDGASDLSLADRVDVLAFILRANGWRTGPIELSPDSAGLDLVRFRRVGSETP